MSDNNNIVAMNADAADQAILADRLNGLSVYELSLKYKKAARTITRSLARTLPELTPELRVRLFQEDLTRIDVLLGVYYQQARSGNIAAAGIVVKLLERRASMVGGAATTRIEIVPSGATEHLGSTEALLQELDRIASERPGGGPVIEADPLEPPSSS